MKYQLLKYASVLSLALFSAPLLAAGTLNILHWAEYAPPEMYEKFEKEHDVKINLDYMDSNDHMLAKVKVGKSGYDIAAPSDYMVKILIDEGLLDKVQPNKFSNFKNVDPIWIDVYYDKGREYSVPWAFGWTGIAVDTDKYKGDINTWAIVLDPPEELKGRISVLSESIELVNAAQFYLGIEPCSKDPKDLKAINDLLVKAKPSWRTITNDLPIISSSDVDVIHQWNGDIMKARLENRPSLKYGYPKEGSLAWTDSIVVLKDAPNKENAKLFMNFMMEPENAAMMSNFTRYPNPIKGSGKFMDKVLSTAPELNPPEGVTLPITLLLCDQETLDIYNKIWTNLLK